MDARNETGSAPERSAQAQDQKKGVLTSKRPSTVRSIAEAVVIKDRDVFFLCEPSGQVPLEDGHGLGLYHHDCRYLDGYELEVDGTRPSAVTLDPGQGFMAAFGLLAMTRAAGSSGATREDVAVQWRRVIDTDSSLRDVLKFRNYGMQPLAFELALAFRARFEDVFVVRGLVDEAPIPCAPCWQGGDLLFARLGADGRRRTLRVTFDPPPDERSAEACRFRLTVPAGEEREVSVLLNMDETNEYRPVRHASAQGTQTELVAAGQHRSAEEWLSDLPQFESDSLVLDRTIDRSLRDLCMLRSRLDDHAFFAAGVPWFATLFGRDSLITALQALAFEPRVAADTLRLLAARQGRRFDRWRDEEPGKILHELRVGELARAGRVPHNPYYGTVDATPLFLILLARHAESTGDLSLFGSLQKNVEAALSWLDRFGDGFVAYDSPVDKGLVNQGWKDSGDAIVNADGTLARPPIALVEVQVYAFMARREIAQIYRRIGEVARADRLESQAASLRARVERHFWLEEQGSYALALQGDGTPCTMSSSNAGHALWGGIAGRGRAGRVAETLTSPDLFSGWGIRTLSRRERPYDPLSYHRGSVWPHDNALIGAGLRRYGFDTQACTLLRGLVTAAMSFDGYRLPELFAGFGQDEFEAPVRYPVACHPQAWAAGAVPYLLTRCLGVFPDGFEQRLRILRPVLPEFVDRLELRGLSIGQGKVDLRFKRQDGRANVEVLRCPSDVDVVLEEEADFRDTEF